MRPTRRKVLPTHRHLDRRRRPQRHHPAHNIRRLKRKQNPGKRLRQPRPQRLPQRRDRRPPRLQLNLQRRLLRTTVPLVNQIHRIVRRMHPHQPHARRDRRLLPDDRQSPQRHLLRCLQPRRRRRPQPQLNLPRIDRRKNLRPQKRQHHPHRKNHPPQIHRHQHMPHRHTRQKHPPQPRPTLHLRSPVIAPLPVPPNAQNRHQRARQQIRRHHRKPHRQGQRQKQRPRRPRHEEARHKHRQNAQHTQRPRPDRLLRRIQNHPPQTMPPTRLPAAMNVLDLHRRLIHQDPHRQRQTPQRHQIDRIPRHPEPQHRRRNRNRNVQHHNEHTPPVPQENQHHQPR